MQFKSEYNKRLRDNLSTSAPAANRILLSTTLTKDISEAHRRTCTQISITFVRVKPVNDYYRGARYIRRTNWRAIKLYVYYIWVDGRRGDGAQLLPCLRGAMRRHRLTLN